MQKNGQIDKIFMILEKRDPWGSSAPDLELYTHMIIIVKQVYCYNYIQRSHVSVYRTIGPLVL